jgi:predicted AAA+ superfamily ATPase
VPHLRNRFLKKRFQHHLKHWPIVGLLGPRQCGKSAFLRELVWGETAHTYRTLDSLAVRRRAEESPELFLSEVENYPLIVDEVQKAPALFDELKAVVDLQRIPGRFVISGSVQFSKKTGIRESLTGRIAILRLDTMTLKETTSDEVDLATVSRYLSRGGMPGVCFSRDEPHRNSYWEQWLDTLCEKDLRAFSGGRLSPDIARRILEQTALLELPTALEIAHQLRIDVRRVNTHLEALRDLFVIHSINPDPAGSGKTIHLPFDTGLATYLKAELRRKWQIWFITEALNQTRFAGSPQPAVQYYLTRRGSFIDFSTAGQLHLFSDLPHPDHRLMMTANAAELKFKDRKISIYCPTDAPSAPLTAGIRTEAWSNLAIQWTVATPKIK